MVTAYNELILAGRQQITQGTNEGLMYCTAYAMVFNDSVDPNPPTTDMTAADCLESAIANYAVDELFVQRIFVEPPVYPAVPDECKAEEVEYFEEVEDIYTTLDQLANVADYMLNPVYPLASRTEEYYSCANPTWTDLC